MAWTEHRYDTAQAMAIAVAAALAAAAADAIAHRGQAQFAIAGGRTPLPALCRWAAEATADTRVAITPTDERWLPATHADSNLARLKACFPGAYGPAWHALVPAAPGPAPVLDAARDTLARLPAPWDLVLLGMGEDGHIASLFPTDPQLAAALAGDGSADAVIAIPQPLPPDAPYPRISQTLSRLLRSRRRLLVVSGAGKRALLDRAQADPDPLRWPVCALLHAPGPAVEIHWSP